MRSFVFTGRWIQNLLPILVLLLTSAAVFYFYRETPSLTGIHGIAEAREYTISSVETGRVASVEVILGQRVYPDQIVAVLDKEVLEQQIRVAQAELQELTANVAAETKTLDMNNLETTRGFQSDLEKSEIELQGLQAECVREKAERDGTQEELQRQRGMVQRQLASANRLHELQIRFNQLQQGLGTCPSRIELLAKRKEATQRRYEQWLARRDGQIAGNSYQEQLRPLELRTVRQKEYLQLLKMQLDHMVLRSPTHGFVAGVMALKGDVVNPGTSMITLVEANPRQVIAYLEEEREPRVEVGHKAILHSRTAATIRMEGSVVAIAETMAQVPSRFWTSPTRPCWGRQVFIRIPSSQSIMPGAAFDVAFKQADTAALFHPVAASTNGVQSINPSGGELKPLLVPPELRVRSRFEPSGVTWIEKLHRYLSVSDDTGWERRNKNSPWLFTIAEQGQVDSEPMTIEGLPTITDMEGIASSAEGNIWIIASQSVNTKGIRRLPRTVFASLRLQANRLQAESYVYFYDLLFKTGRDNPDFYNSLGLNVVAGPGGPSVEIEGLTWHENALYFGLKAPLDSRGQALIWKLGNPEALFRQQSLAQAELKLWKKALLLVEDRPAGISELLFLPDGSLVLAGVNEKGGSLFHTAEIKDEVLKPKPFQNFLGRKPEGLCLSPARRLVVMFDEQENNPLWTQLELPQ